MILLIGGTQDGKRILDPKTQTITYPKLEIYFRRMVQWGGDKHEFYAIGSLTQSQILDLLLRGYRTC